MFNTTASQQWREKYMSKTLATALRNGLVAEKVFKVDTSDAKVIKSPYQTAPTTVVQALTGTYTPAAFTTTNDTLTVAYEFIVSEHIFDFEDILSDFDIYAARIDDMTYSVMASIDQYVINKITDQATGSYTTPAGGFTTPANIPVIISNLASKVMGYSDAYKGLFLIIENTDVPGFMQAQIGSGFSYSDAALNNGFMTNYAGVDIHVVRSGLFTNTDIGDHTDQNSGHRLFGVKGVATYASPRGVRFEEKGVSGKTGKEVVVYGYIGANAWVPKRDLLVDITIA